MRSCRRIVWAVALALVLTGAGNVAPATAAPALPSNDPFYSYSGPLGGMAPGTVLRSRTVTIAESGNATPVTATQVLYRTTGELGQPTATVATVFRPAPALPLVSAPVSLSRIVSYQTAYDALGSQCDPSYTLQGGNPGYSTAQAEEQVILGYVSAGDIVVVPDYEGERLDWAAGQESGYGTLDGIRATENLLNLSRTGTPVGMVGYSGGSIATEFASELAPAYAPELRIAGTAEGGVPVDFFHNLAYINGSKDWSGVIPAVLVSLARAFQVSFHQYLSPYGLQVTGQVQSECINSFLGAYPGLTYQKLLGAGHQNIYGIAPFVRIGDQLIMSRTGTPRGPLFLGVGNADGTGDGVMVAKDVQALAYTYCRRGVSVQFTQYNGDDHTQAAVPFEQGAFTFLTQRLSGQSVANGCASIGPGNSLAPLPVPGGGRPASPQLRFRYLGRRHGGIAIELWTSTGTLRHLEITLRRNGRRLVVSLDLARVGTRRRVIVLRVRGHRIAAGHYRLAVFRGHRRLLVRRLAVR